VHRLPHPKGVGTQKPKVFTRVISIFQLFGRVLQYLSDWLITRRHSYPYLRGWFRGFYRGCAVYWGPFWLSMFPFVHLYFFLNVFVVCCTAVWPCSHSCVIKLSVCVQRLSVIVFLLFLKCTNIWTVVHQQWSLSQRVTLILTRTFQWVSLQLLVFTSNIYHFFILAICHPYFVALHNGLY